MGGIAGAVGGLSSGIFDLFSGNPEASEENALGTLGAEQTATGENLVTPAATYYEDILSGDPTKMAQALSPEISAGQGQLEQSRLTGSEFGTRSGGTTAAGNSAAAAERSNIINLMGGLQSGAASSAGSLGSSQESAGSGNISKEAEMAVANQDRIGKDIGGIAGGVAGIATSMIPSGDDVPSGSDPYETLYNAQHPDRSSIETQSNDLSSSSIGEEPMQQFQF